MTAPIRCLVILIVFGLGAATGYVYARKHPDYSNYWGYDRITRSEWWVLGWGTDPTEQAQPEAGEGGGWCKPHIDGNGSACNPAWKPNR